MSQSPESQPTEDPTATEAAPTPDPRPDQPQTDQPQADQPQTDQPQPDQPQTDQPQAGQPQADHAAAAAAPQDPEAAAAATEEPATQPDPAAYPPEAKESHTATHAADSAAPAEQSEGATAGAEGSPQTPAGDDAEPAADAADKGEQTASKKKKKNKNKDANLPAPAQIIKRIGTTTEQALAYVAKPDPQLSRLSKKAYEALLPELPPVTAGALLGPAALTRHLIASSAAGRYRDLFFLWDVFRAYPDDAKPEISARSEALEKGQRKLEAATRIGLVGQAPELVAEDVARAEGLIWQWLRAVLVAKPELVGRRPAVASALLTREPDLEVPLPEHPDETWLAEAASARVAGELAPAVDKLLSEHAHRLPATLETLRLATRHYPDRVEALIDRVELDSPDIGAFLAWARDHQASDRLHGRVREQVSGAAARDLTEGLSRWHHWMQRGVHLDLPPQLVAADIDQFDLTRPETAALAKKQIDGGGQLDLQSRLEQVAAANTQRGEKAYEAMVCEDLPVNLPAALEGNPAVKEGTRCPKCRAWTWVRPGHEQRCPRPEPVSEHSEPALSAFELAAAEATGSTDTDSS